MNISDYVRRGLEFRDPVSGAGVIGLGRTTVVIDAERISSLEAGEIRQLPTSEERVEHPRPCEERKVVDQAEFEYVLFVKVRGRTIGRNVIGVANDPIRSAV